MSYVGRFAPSPTGPLHEGSLCAALASWLDARAHGGRWLVRIEDVDTARCVPGADLEILRQLEAVGLHPDQAPVWQNERAALYQVALDKLVVAGSAYPCACSRREIELRQTALRARHAELIYPGTCRAGTQGRTPRAIRLLTAENVRNGWQAIVIDWHDRRLGAQSQNLAREVGDFVLHRADGLWAYQLAVVVDDAQQCVTHVVRGADLADNTARQIHLQRLLGVPAPSYLHTPLVFGADGEKLSKQNGATPLDLSDPLAALRRAAAVLGIRSDATELAAWLLQAVAIWREKWLA